MVKKEGYSADVIVVSHNNKDIIGNCLDSIKNQSYRNFKIMLLDNDSNDGTEEYVMSNYKEVLFSKFLKKGPSEKRNIGIKESHGDYVVFMDSDARLTKDWLKIAIEYMDSHQDIGICGGKIMMNKDLIDSAGGIIAKNLGATDRGYNEIDKGQYETFGRVSFIKSASVIVRKKMLEEIGGFDSDYFYLFEDADLGLRANIFGWKVIYNPNLVSYHLSHQTVGKDSEKSGIRRNNRNKQITFLKNFQTSTIVKYSPLIFVDFFGSLLTKKYKWEILKAYIDVLKSLGKTMEKRKKIQSLRKISDKELFDKIDFPILIRNKDKKKNKIINFIRNIKSKKLLNLTFFITKRCNSRCKHCFYWKSLNNGGDLSLEDIEKILSKFYNVRSVLLSGGEPFIRNDYPEVIDLVVKYLDPELIITPTNCLDSEKILKNLEDSLKNHKDVKFRINCSLDGTEEYHDYIRGVKGSFNKTLNFIKEINKLRKIYPNLSSVGVNTVIMDKNKNDIEELIEIIKGFEVGDHSFDLIRGDHQGIFKLPEKEELKKIGSLIYKTKKYYNKIEHKNFLKRLFYNLNDRNLILTQMEVLNGKKWKFKCSAGINDIVLESDGNLRICELTPKLGSLLESSPEDLLKSERSKKIFEMIKKHDCDCTHICNLSSSMTHSYRNLFVDRLLLDNLKTFKYFK